MQKKYNINKSRQSGYIGLLALLITVAIIAVAMWRSDLFVGSKDESGKTQNVIERDLKAIDAAQSVKDKIEFNNQKSVEGI
jgi:hypothetical protein